jgi:hypothetical protein
MARKRKYYLKNNYLTLRSKVKVITDRGMSWEMAMTRFENYKGPNDGFYISRRDMWGRKLCILATQKENSSHLVDYQIFAIHCTTPKIKVLKIKYLIPFLGSSFTNTKLVYYLLCGIVFKIWGHRE